MSVTPSVPNQNSRKPFRIRTWPVFLLGMGSLLVLSFLPGLVVLWRTSRIYPEVRRLQDQQQRTQRLITQLERNVYGISLIIRECLMDQSPAHNSSYQVSFAQLRTSLLSNLSALRAIPELKDKSPLPALEREVLSYLQGAEPVLTWSVSQRASRGLYFLRMEQRTRSNSVVDIAERVNHLTDAAYARQIDQLNEGQLEFAADTQRVILVAFLIGGMIAVLTVARLVILEERAEVQRAQMAQAEMELRTLSMQLMNAQEVERKSISRELHDEVGQILTGLRMGLGALVRARPDQAEFERQLNGVKALAEQALRSIRDLAVGLRPSVLDLGLLPALQFQARRFSSYSGLPVHIRPESDAAGVPEEHRICIYRVVQECLTNAAKHSGAKSVEIHLKEASGMIEVTVQDDGIGFARLPGAQGGIGLIGMEERVHDLKGSLTVESSPAVGTKVRVRLPLPAKPVEEHS